MVTYNYNHIIINKNASVKYQRVMLKFGNAIYLTRNIGISCNVI